MAELGNLTARIVLSLARMSTVKIRAGSEVRTSRAAIGAAEAALAGVRGGKSLCAASSGMESVFLATPQSLSDLHRFYTAYFGFALAESGYAGAKSKAAGL